MICLIKREKLDEINLRFHESYNNPLSIIMLCKSSEFDSK